MIVFYLLTVLILIFLNAFFVLAEFAAVKMRSSRVQELIDQGHVRAKVFHKIQTHLDEYLSVCQLGITFASIGLGFIGEPAIATLVEPIISWTGMAKAAVAHSIAVIIAYLLVSFLHILLGELLPKSMAIRTPERSALISARPLQLFRLLFYVPFVILNSSSNLILRVIGMSLRVREERHTEEELRIILASSQKAGLIPFRRLLLLENIFDLGDLMVKDAMKPKESVKVLRLRAPWGENHKTILESRFSRYPLIEAEGSLPIGIVHIKDLYYYPKGSNAMSTEDLKRIARPYYTVTEDKSIETLLGELQRRRGHFVIVTDKRGKWTGILTMEDIIEEITGQIEDEFEVEAPFFLGDYLKPGCMVFGVEATSIEEAIRQALSKISTAELPLSTSKTKIVNAILERERAMSTFIGHGLSVPHARLVNLEKPLLILARSEEGILIEGREDKAYLIFILLTPLHLPHLQVRLLARIARIMESEYVHQRLLEATIPQEVIEIIRAAETAVLS